MNGRGAEWESRNHFLMELYPEKEKIYTKKEDRGRGEGGGEKEKINKQKYIYTKEKKKK